MDSKRAAMVMLLLLLLLSGWGHSEGPRDWDGDELFVVSRPWPHVTILPSLGRAFCPSFRHTLATGGVFAVSSQIRKRVLGSLFVTPGCYPLPSHWSPGWLCSSLPSHSVPLCPGRRQWGSASAGRPEHQVPPALPAGGHGETGPEPSLPVPAPEVSLKGRTHAWQGLGVTTGTEEMGRAGPHARVNLSRGLAETPGDHGTTNGCVPGGARGQVPSSGAWPRPSALGRNDKWVLP